MCPENSRYSLTIEEIKAQILSYKASGKKLFTTSSFQTHSIVLLHIISETDNSIPVYFLNTGYLFPETLKFRDKISDMLGLNVIDLQSLTPKSMQKDGDGRLFFVSDPDHCCSINKTQPLERILASYDIWINGVRADQSAARKAMKVEQAAPFGVTRYHPMLDWDARSIYAYRKKYNLPSHPMESKGYFSVGCEPCTRKIDPAMQEREARWYGMNKTECGLHTDLINK